MSIWWMVAAGLLPGVAALLLRHRLAFLTMGAGIGWGLLTALPGWYYCTRPAGEAPSKAIFLSAVVLIIGLVAILWLAVLAAGALRKAAGILAVLGTAAAMGYLWLGLFACLPAA